MCALGMGALGAPPAHADTEGISQLPGEPRRGRKRCRTSRAAEIDLGRSICGMYGSTHPDSNAIARTLMSRGRSPDSAAVLAGRVGNLPLPAI